MFVTLVIWSCSWWFIPTRKTETRKKHINDCERAERASRNLGTFASETCDPSQSVNNILLVKTSVQYVLVLVDLFRNTYNDDTDEPETRKNNYEMNASGPNELKVSYICIGNTQFCQYFDTMMSLCCLICTDEINFFLLLIFSSFHPPPPHPRPRYFFLHLPFSQSSPSHIWALPPPLF